MAVIQFSPIPTISIEQVVLNGQSPSIQYLHDTLDLRSVTLTWPIYNTSDPKAKLSEATCFTRGWTPRLDRTSSGHFLRCIVEFDWYEGCFESALESRILLSSTRRHKMPTAKEMSSAAI